MRRDLPNRLEFMADMAEKALLKNLASALREAAQEVRAMEWQLQAFKNGAVRHARRR